MLDRTPMVHGDVTSNKILGRLAPSPTGAQHLGNARTFLLAWWLARKSKGKIYLRIEDLDTPRIKAWATDQVLQDLRWLGIDWDDYPEMQNHVDGEPREYLLQSNRVARYEEVFRVLQSNEMVYPCTCTRSDIDSSQSAPHEGFNQSPLDGVSYPGMCASRKVCDALALDAQGRRYAWRFRFSSQPRKWIDQFLGPQELHNPQLSLGDFVIARSNGSAAYQLAVVVDDHDMGINQVVRGSDLIYSTYRQLSIYEYLGWRPPSYFHFPLVVGTDGMRLAKRHGDTRLSMFREQGVAPEAIVGYLAFYSGWIDRFEPMTATDLLSIDLLSRQMKSELVVTDEHKLSLLSRI